MTRAGAAASPSPGSRCCGSPRETATAAAAGIRRALDEARERPQRARLLPAYVEIMLAVGDAEAARGACAELEQVAGGQESDMLSAMAAHARGALDLAAGDARAALVALRRAARAWQELDAPYEAARSRALVGLACRALGDDDAAAFELEAARGVLAGSARADLAAASARPARPPPSRRADARELEVLRLVADGRATGRSPRAGRQRAHGRPHLQNIFAKLGVSSRTAASAFAFAHDLVSREWSEMTTAGPRVGRAGDARRPPHVASIRACTSDERARCRRYPGRRRRETGATDGLDVRARAPRGRLLGLL